MCASGPARLHSRGAGRCAVLRGRGPPWRRCWRCPWCWSGTQPCRTGRELCAARPRRLLILISSSRLGQSSPGAPAICFLRKSLLRAWHVSCVVLPVFLPSLPTPSSSCRCGFDVFQHAPFLSGAVQVPPSSSKGCPRGGVAKEPSWGGQSCLRAAQRGGGLSLSQDSRLPHPDCALPSARLPTVSRLRSFSALPRKACLPEGGLMRVVDVCDGGKGREEGEMKSTGKNIYI